MKSGKERKKDGAVLLFRQDLARFFRHCIVQKAISRFKLPAHTERRESDRLPFFPATLTALFVEWAKEKLVFCQV